MNTMKKNALAASLGIFTMLVCASSMADNPPDISGTYNCKAHDALDNPPDFTETTVFKKTGDGVYSVQLLATGKVIPDNLGTAVFNKDVNNALSYVYWSAKGATAAGGVEFMIVKPDGSLDGIFSDLGKTHPGTEICTKS